MTITAHCTDRKAMVKTIAEHLGLSAEYLGVPSCAYGIGNIRVERDGNLTGAEEDLTALVPFLREQGFVTEDVPVTEPAASDAEHITHTCISIPLNEFTPTAVTNLLKLLYARQKLIGLMTQSECVCVEEEVLTLLNDSRPDTPEKISELVMSEARMNMIKGITVAEHRLTLEFPYDEANPTQWKAYAALMMALVERAKESRHVNSAMLIPKPEESKYLCHSFLMQLGLRGSEHAETRHTLLDHLQGYAAFKSNDRMEAHKARVSQRRRAAREASGSACENKESI